MRLPSLIAKRLSRFCFLPCVVLLALTDSAPAQEPAVSIFAVARQKIQTQEITKSAQLGFGINRIAFSDMPAQGGILVGFDIQLSKFLDYEVVHALKPLYATEKGEIATTEFGDFANRPGKKKNTNLTRNVRIKAPQGFAVGGITVRSGLFIDGLKLTYYAIKGQGLDTERASVSTWIGNDRHGQSEKTIGNNGMPIVGIFGNRDDQRVMAVGICQISAPILAAPQQVAPPPPANVAEPANAEPHPPRISDVADRREAPAAKPADVPEKAEELAKADDVAEKAEPNPELKERGDQQLPWLPVAIFGAVSMVVFAGCWLVMSGRRMDKAPGKPQNRQAVVKNEPRKTPPPISDEPQVVSATATSPKTPAAPVGVPAGAFTSNALVRERTSQPYDDDLGKVPSVVRAQPPYFNARAVFALKVNRFYRVYILPDKLLFLDAGPETNDGCARGIAAAGAVTGGLLGAVVGSAIGAIIDSTRQGSPEARRRLFDCADTEQLVRLADEGAPNFRVALEDLQNARLEPTSAWHSIQYFGNKYVGLFRFHHPDHGELTLEIPDMNNMKIALTELPQAFGDNLDVKVEFDRHSWTYVAKG